MAWDLKVPGRVYLGNDGGTYRSDVNGSNDQWTSAVSQPFTQFYSVDVSEQDSSRLVGGAQDNGVNRSYRRDGMEHLRRRRRAGGADRSRRSEHGLRMQPIRRLRSID